MQTVPAWEEEKDNPTLAKTAGFSLHAGFHGVLAPNSALRHHVTLAGRGKRKPTEAKTPAQRRAAMTWAQRLKRGFKIDIETCDQCGGTTKVIACIEDPAVVKRILDHLEQRPESDAIPTLPARAPPAAAQREGS